MWQYTGQKRPPFAVEPRAGQESVWDYPRPPVVVPDTRLVEVRHGERRIASTRSALRVLETASPPTFYLPVDDIDLALLVRASGSSGCEWKGVAHYWALVDAPERGPVGWGYDAPQTGFAQLRAHLAFYPGRLDCFVDGERVVPQPGGFYGGWITADIAGPVKGAPGTSGW